MRCADPRVLACALVLVASGCNRVFGLLEVAGSDDDSDARDPDDDSTVHGCWNPPQIGHDEDMDSIDDGCDNCPADPNAAQTDGDDDGVGDECDPRLTKPDRIVFFEGFSEVAGTVAWSEVRLAGSPSWSIAEDKLHVTAGTSDDGVLQLTEQSFNAAIVDIRYDRASTYQTCGTWLRIQQPQDPGADHVACETISSGLHVVYGSDVGFSVYSPMGPARLIAADVGVCTAFTSGVAGTVSLTSLVASTTGTIGVHVQGAPADVYSVTVFEPLP